MAKIFSPELSAMVGYLELGRQDSHSLDTWSAARMVNGHCLGCGHRMSYSD